MFCPAFHISHFRDYRNDENGTFQRNTTKVVDSSQNDGALPKQSH